MSFGESGTFVGKMNENGEKSVGKSWEPCLDIHQGYGENSTYNKPKKQQELL